MRSLGGRERGSTTVTRFTNTQDAPTVGVGVPRRLTVAQILTWADGHYRATGNWPSHRAGRVRQAIEFVTWHAIEVALVHGSRGLPGGQTLAGLLHEHRGLMPGRGEGVAQAGTEAFSPEPANEGTDGAPLTVERIVEWADAHHAATGLWPRVDSGPIAGIPGESWSSINSALERGRNGLPGGTTLRRLLVQHCGPQARRWLPTLTVGRTLAWADSHFEATGQWPSTASGPVVGAPKLTWRRINRLLRQGGRGLPGGSSLARVLAEQRGAQGPR
jgi:hypothetical protein